MIGLLRPELRRAVHRRVTIGVILGLLALTLFMLWGENRRAAEFGPAGRAAAEQQFEQQHADWLKNHDQMVQDCQNGTPPDILKSDPSVCAIPEPQLQDFLPFGGSLKSLTVDVGASLKPMLLLGTFILGASLVCAEFASGAISTWLTFVPRRRQVYASKVAAAGITGLVAAAISCLALLAGLLFIASHVELTVTGAQRTELLATLGRAALLGLYGGLLGAAVGFVVRHTAAAIGVALGYLIAFEMILLGNVPSVAPWILGTNLSAFVDHGTTYGVDKCTKGADNGFMCTTVTHHVSFTHGWLFLLAAAIVILLIGLARFTRRDVN